MEYKSRDLFGDFQQLLTLIERVEIISVPMFLLIFGSVSYTHLTLPTNSRV